MKSFYTLIEPSYPSSQNMVRDIELLLKSQTLQTPILRIYSWKTPTISIGKMQKAENILNLAKIPEEDITVVQRPTGGRAVLHKNDLTYSFFIPSQSSQFGKSLTETYAILAQALQTSLQLLNMQTNFAQKRLEPQEIIRNHKLPCFISPNRNEILFQGKKLIGSAQLRRKEGIMQHGSLPIDNSFIELPLYELIETEKQQQEIRLLEEASTSVHAYNRAITFSQIAEAFIEGFSKSLGLSHLSLSS